jgi:hypothetical protein
MRYSAQSERLYRRAIADFDRIKALGGAGGARDDCGPGAHDPCGPACALPETVLQTEIDQTNPNPPEPPQTEPLTPSDPTPETTPADPNPPESPAVDSGNPWDPPFWFTNGACREGCVCPKCLAEKAALPEKPIANG